MSVQFPPPPKDTPEDLEALAKKLDEFAKKVDPFWASYLDRQSKLDDAWSGDAAVAAFTALARAADDLSNPSLALGSSDAYSAQDTVPVILSDHAGRVREYVAAIQLQRDRLADAQRDGQELILRANIYPDATSRDGAAATAAEHIRSEERIAATYLDDARRRYENDLENTAVRLENLRIVPKLPKVDENSGGTTVLPPLGDGGFFVDPKGARAAGNGLIGDAGRLEALLKQRNPAKVPGPNERVVAEPYRALVSELTLQLAKCSVRMRDVGETAVDAANAFEKHEAEITKKAEALVD